MIGIWRNRSTRHRILLFRRPPFHPKSLAVPCPAAVISLIYEHTEKIRPPRALWVPFELGRPLGLPNDARFQKKVLRAALELFEAEQGPVLAAFEEEAPASGSENSAEQEEWACPVNFSAPQKQETDPEQRVSAFQREITELRPWYDLGPWHFGWPPRT